MSVLDTRVPHRSPEPGSTREVLGVDLGPLPPTSYTHSPPLPSRTDSCRFPPRASSLQPGSGTPPGSPFVGEPRSRTRRTTRSVSGGSHPLWATVLRVYDHRTTSSLDPDRHGTRNPQRPEAQKPRLIWVTHRRYWEPTLLR